MATIAGRYDASGETVKAAEVLFGPLLGRDLGLRLWNGTSVPAPPQTATLVLNAPYAIRTAFSAPLDLNPGRAFVKGIIDVEGDLESAIDVLMRAAGTHDPLRLGSIALRLSRLPKEPSDERGPQRRLLGRRHSKERDAQAIAHHYDLPFRFFETFLGRSLVYSCAYYEREHMSLDEAQEAKLDLICRKLLLSRGEQLLDIGCGWGSLVIHAARRYGVRALGITASESQAREARRRVEEAGLSDCVRIERRDYRDLRGERFDKIASVGMIEHVGIKKLPGYFDAAFRALRAGGLFLNHGISDQSPGRRGYRASGFIHEFVFPDGELPPLASVLRSAEASGFEVRDVENLREHYARTLRDWVHNLEHNHAAVLGIVNEATYRVWRLYMAGSAQGFHRGRMGLSQILLARPSPDGFAGLPPTRAHLYGRDAGSMAPLRPRIGAERVVD